MQSNIKIDDYAKSMFQFEYLTPAWISRCSKYLKSVFESRIKGKVIVDYAFGRGNWALAFLEAGAKKVIAIDASHSNVNKLSEYVKQYNIDKCEVVEGNILKQPVEAKADILWVYGILPCITEPEVFLSSLSELARNENSECLLYAYNEDSLRQVIVDLGRTGIIYKDYDEFVADSLAYSTAARLRARDDLTAPIVTWYSRQKLCDLALDTGYSPEKFVQSFQESEGQGTLEFRPHHLYCKFLSSAGSPQNIGNPFKSGNERRLIDLDIIQELGLRLMECFDAVSKKKLTIGLFNTHFGALSMGGYEKCLQDDFLYLLYNYMVLGISPVSELQKDIMDFSKCALKGIARPNLNPDFSGSLIFRFLNENNIRI